MNHIMKLFLMIAIIGLTAPMAGAQNIDELRKRAEAGDAQAMNDMALMYGNGKGVAWDGRKALGLFRAAAEKGNAEAQYHMGFLYQKPWLVNKNYGRSAEWYQKSAIQGFSPAQLNLAILYEKGWGVDKNPLLAYMWFTVASKNLPNAANMRDERIRSLTAAQRTTGDAMAERCIKSNFKNCSN